MEALRTKIEQGTASLQRYLASVEVRQDTKVSLLLGLSVGLASVFLFTAYPGKPIDYSQAGTDLPEGMKGGERPYARKAKTEERAVETAPLSEKEMVGRIQDQARGVRRRKGQEHRQYVPIAADKNKPKVTARDEVGWTPSRLDEDSLARRIGSSKAARMLGLTEDQVRQAVLDAKEEMQSGEENARTIYVSAGGDNSDGGLGLSSMISFVVVTMGLAGLWLHLSTNQTGSLARFLLGAFPREMATLGLSDGQA